MNQDTGIQVSYDRNNDAKAILVSPTLIKMKTKAGDVHAYDFRHAIGTIGYTNDQAGNDFLGFQVIANEYSKTITFTRMNPSGKSKYLHIPSDLSGFPYFMLFSADETETDEPATKTTVFPPPETIEQWFERIYARVLHLTRRIKVLRHEEPHQNALSERICREVPEDHDEVLRYDIACNLIKRPVGWLTLQLQTFQTRYNAHLEKVVKAKEAGTTPPTFNPGSDQTKIETMLEKLETHLTEECLENHFDLHDHAEWDKIQNKQRKITLCADDYSPGEVLVDINSFFTDGGGNIAEEHAKKTYHDISTKYWVMAKRTPHREQVIHRVVQAV